MNVFLVELHAIGPGGHLRGTRSFDIETVHESEEVYNRILERLKDVYPAGWRFSVQVHPQRKRFNALMSFLPECKNLRETKE